MTKVFKPISFYDRLHNPVHMIHVDFVHPPHRVLQFSEATNEKTGVLTRRSKYVTVNRKEEMKNYAISDFAIENLQAIGANLNTVQLSADTDMAMRHVYNAVSKIPFESQE